MDVQVYNKCRLSEPRNGVKQVILTPHFMRRISPHYIIVQLSCKTILSRTSRTLPRSYLELYLAANLQSSGCGVGKGVRVVSSAGIDVALSKILAASEESRENGLRTKVGIGNGFNGGIVLIGGVKFGLMALIVGWEVDVVFAVDGGLINRVAVTRDISTSRGTTLQRHITNTYV